MPLLLSSGIPTGLYLSRSPRLNKLLSPTSQCTVQCLMISLSVVNYGRVLKTEYPGECPD